MPLSLLLVVISPARLGVTTQAGRRASQGHRSPVNPSLQRPENRVRPPQPPLHALIASGR